MGDERRRVADYWGSHEATGHLERIHWMASPVVRDYLDQLASGDPDLDWFRWAWRRFVAGGRERRGLSVLVLGCGTGWLDRFVARQPEVGTVVACDVAEGAVEQAREAARREGLEARIRYHVVDLNHEPPPGGPHDVAIAHSVLHHVEDLERAYPALAGSLVPGGLLIFNEYVGPRRFQFTPEQMAVVNGALARLPERYRRSLMMPGAVFPHKEVPTEEQMIAVDPSESVRSDELLAFTRRHFRVLEERPYGGTVLHLLLYDVVQNFDPASLEDGRLLGLLCLLEEALLREGQLPSDYALVVARREDRGERPAASESGAGEPSPAALHLDPQRQPVPTAVPVRRTVARLRGEVPPPAPRRSIHSRPRRDLRLGWDLPPLRDHLHRLATGNPRTPWTTWVLDELLPELERDGGHLQVLPGEPPEEGGRRVLLVDPRLDGLEAAVAKLPGVVAVDVLEATRGGETSGEATFRLRRSDGLAADRGPAAGGAPSQSTSAQGTSAQGTSTQGTSTTASGAAAPARPLSALDLPPCAYALIFTQGCLGRAADRRAFARRLVAALAPGGLLVGDEWLGPRDGRTTPRTLGYARQVVELLQPPGAPEPGAVQRLRRRLVDLEHRLLGPAPPRRRTPAPSAGPRAADARRRAAGSSGDDGPAEGRGDGLLSPRHLEPPRGPLAEVLEELLGPDCPPLVVRPTGGALLQRVLPALEPFLLEPADPAPPPADEPGTPPAAEEPREAALAAFVALAAYLEELLSEAGVVASEYACFVARRGPGS